MNGLVAAWPSPSYFPMNVTCELRFVNTGIVSKLQRA
jgi:hypothetical protein